MLVLWIFLYKWLDNRKGITKKILFILVSAIFLIYSIAYMLIYLVILMSKTIFDSWKKRN